MFTTVDDLFDEDTVCYCRSKLAARKSGLLVEVRHRVLRGSSLAPPSPHNSGVSVLVCSDSVHKSLRI